MGLLVLVPWPETAWSAAGRIPSRTSLPLTDIGRKESTTWADSLALFGLSTVYSSDEQAAEEVAQLVADRCGARRRVDADFAEVDAGLWTGLTHEELKQRDTKLFKRWLDNPAGVCPPEGEDLATASVRLNASLGRVLGKLGERHVAVVLGPLAFATLRCRIESADVSQVCSMMDDEPLKYETEADADGEIANLGPPTRVIASGNACVALGSANGDGQGA